MSDGCALRGAPANNGMQPTAADAAAADAERYPDGELDSLGFTVGAVVVVVALRLGWSVVSGRCL